MIRAYQAPTLALLLLFAASIDQRAAAEAVELKTMSFNIRADFNFGAASSDANAWISTSGSHRRDLASAVINDYEPDILGVQEAFNNQVDDLKSALPNYSFYGVGREDGATLGEYSGIFYRSDRFTQTEQGTFWLSLTPDTPSFYPGTTFRIASWVILEDNQAGDQEYFILNSHWAQGFPGTEAREYSAGLVRDRVKLLAGNRPLMVMGDLNAFDFQPAYLNLLGQDDPNGFQLVDSYRTIFPVQGPNERTNHGFIGHIDGQRIDYMLHSNDFHANAAEIVHTSYSGSYPSDHYPITTNLTLVPEGDFNFDGEVDGTDLLIWQRGESPDPLSSSDLADWVTNYGPTTPLSATTVVVPEPSSWAIMLTTTMIPFSRIVVVAQRALDAAENWDYHDQGRR